MMRGGASGRRGAARRGGPREAGSPPRGDAAPPAAVKVGGSPGKAKALPPGGAVGLPGGARAGSPARPGEGTPPGARDPAAPPARRVAELEEALAAARAQHEDLLASLQDAVIVVSPGGEVVSWNPAAEELLKVSAPGAVGRPFHRVLPQAGALAALLRMALETGRPHANFEAEAGLPDGARVTVSAVASLLSGPGGEPRGAVLALRDVSRLRELEEKVRRSERLAALGQMAAGVAHEVRNPLVGIRAAAQLLEAEPAFDPGWREYTGVIVREVDRLNALVEELLAFAAPKAARLVPCNLNQVVEEALALAAAALAAGGIGVARYYDPPLPPVQGDPPRLHQVFLNLFRNAADAMPGGGTLTLRTRFERRSAAIAGRAAAVAEVSDTGPGIAPEVLPHIFNPFFTTKAGGSGLGLALSLRIVEDSGGALVVASEPGRGTTFSVVLPLAPDAGGGAHG